jgi:hypothetical protein
VPSSENNEVDEVDEDDDDPYSEYGHKDGTEINLPNNGNGT